MSDVRAEAAATGRESRAVVAGLLALGAIQLLTGLLMLAAPGTFFDAVASFAPRNDHFIRDLGTFQAAYGATLLWSVRAAAWRLPLIGLGLVQFALHVVNHLVDIDATREEAHGVTNVVTLSAGLILLAWLARAERARTRRP